MLASGNIVFDSDESDAGVLEQRIEAALTADLGLTSRAIVRAQSDLGAFVAADPFDGLTHGQGTYLTVTFLKAATPNVVLPDPETVTDIIGYNAGVRAILAVTENSQPGRAPDFMVWLDRTFGKTITTRSFHTVQRIVARLETRTR